MLQNILAWTGIGIIVGFLINLIFPGPRRYFGGTITAGIVGAFVGGVVYSAVRIGRISMTLDPAASIIAVVGSLVLIYFIHLLVKSEETKKELKS